MWAKMNSLFAVVNKSHEGATAVEYAIMVMLIGLAIIAAVTAIGTTLRGIFASLTF